METLAVLLEDMEPEGEGEAEDDFESNDECDTLGEELGLELVEGFVRLGIFVTLRLEEEDTVRVLGETLAIDD